MALANCIDLDLSDGNGHRYGTKYLREKSVGAPDHYLEIFVEDLARLTVTLRRVHDSEIMWSVDHIDGPLQPITIGKTGNITSLIEACFGPDSVNLDFDQGARDQMQRDCDWLIGQVNHLLLLVNSANHHEGPIVA